jgi:hypothetical protein
MAILSEDQYRQRADRARRMADLCSPNQREAMLKIADECDHRARLAGDTEHYRRAAAWLTRGR